MAKAKYIAVKLQQSLVSKDIDFLVLGGPL